MARRTDIEILRDHLKLQPNQRSSRARLRSDLNWSSEKLERVVLRATEDRRHMIQLGKAGVVRYLGSERGARNDVGLYGDVGRVLTRYFAARSLKARQPEVFDTCFGSRRGHGTWTHPDLVLAAYPQRRKRATDPKQLHAIEVETVKGFDVKSVYQAHAQARGANFAWVFTFSDGIDDTPAYERISWAVQQLGVGLVQFKNPAAYTTYEILFRPKDLEPSEEHRTDFVTRVMNQPADSPLNG